MQKYVNNNLSWVILTQNRYFSMFFLQVTTLVLFYIDYISFERAQQFLKENQNVLIMTFYWSKMVKIWLSVSLS